MFKGKLGKSVNPLCPKLWINKNSTSFEGVLWNTYNNNMKFMNDFVP